MIEKIAILCLTYNFRKLCCLARVNDMFYSNYIQHFIRRNSTLSLKGEQNRLYSQYRFTSSIVSASVGVAVR